MEESQAPQSVEPPPSATASTSLASKLMDVFIAPGEVFAEVKNTPHKPANWIVPMVIAIFVSIACVWISYSQPAIVQSIADLQHQNIQKQVNAGKLTQQQADQIESSPLRGPTFAKIFGTIGAVIATPAMLFLMALVLWLVGKFACHATFPYMKAVEVSGLAMMISSLAGLVTTLIVCIKGNLMVNLGPSLFINNLDRVNKLHVALSQVSLMTLWQIAVLSIGVAKLSGTGWLKPAIWLFGIWALLAALAIALA